MSRSALLAAPLLGALLAAPAAAHEVHHEVARGRALAVRAVHADGRPLAYAAFQVWSPALAEAPHATGLTDRAGWAAFVPDAPGRWRVRVADATGHGLSLEVDADAPATPVRSTAAAVLRPLAGLSALGLSFGALWAVQRRRRAAR